MKKFLKNTCISILAIVAAIGASRTYSFEIFDENFNFSIALTMFALGFAFLSIIFLKKKVVKLPNANILLCYFFAYVIFSAFLSINSSFFAEKIFWFMFFTLMGVVCIFLIDWSLESIKVFFDALFLLSFISIFVYLFAIRVDIFPFRDRILDSYLGFSRAGILGIALSVNSLMFFKFRSLHFIHLILFLVFAFSSGSRGPLIAFFLAVLVMLFLFLAASKAFSTFLKRFMRISIPLFLLPLLFFIGFSLFESSVGFIESSKTIQRLTILFEESDGGTSGSGRLNRLNASISYLLTAEPEKIVFGCGFSCWPIAVKNIEIEPFRDYPHVLVIEILVEMGIVGLILFFGAIWLCFLQVKSSLFKDIYSTSLFFTVILLFFWSFVSGDLNDNFLLFWFICISCFYAKNRAVPVALPKAVTPAFLELQISNSK